MEVTQDDCGGLLIIVKGDLAAGMRSLDQG